jgi:transcription initiation factor TFIIIB Brf1 subunit/transcription initiation factor TFIIB
MAMDLAIFSARHWWRKARDRDSLQGPSSAGTVAAAALCRRRRCRGFSDIC